MQLKQIDILNYKSITSPVSIKFKEGEVVTLIGKNGSGKTNILEALEQIFKSNAKQIFYHGNPNELKYKVHLLLDTNEVSQLLPNIEYDESKSEIVAYNDGNELKINTIESNIIIPLLKNDLLDIKQIANALKTSLNKYLDIVNFIATDDKQRLFSGFKIESDHVTNFYRLKTNIDFNCKNALELVDQLISKFDNNESAIHFISDGILFYGLNELKFQLKYMDPDLSKFEKRYITINTRALKSAITKLNKKTSDICEKITNLSSELTERANKISEALTDYGNYIYDEKEKYYRFIAAIKDCIGKKCIFLKNTNNDLIFSQENHEIYRRHTATDYILETYLMQVYTCDNKKELLNSLASNKQITLNDIAIEEFEDYLNRNIPRFDRGMFKDIQIKNIAGKLNIFIEENGTLVDLNQTSSGRRWYFTYYFLKSTLNKGDIFIIDEPAAMLHPSAQSEVRDQLAELAQNGIKIIYSTHSSYLIPDNFSMIHNVEMAKENGTQVCHYACTDPSLRKVCSDLGIQLTSEILFNLAKTTLLVEGEADKACIKKFANLLDRDLSDYTIFDCRGQPILDVTHLCIQWNVKFKALFDRDTLDDSRKTYLQKLGYASYVEEAQTNPNCVFTSANGNRRALEDCFSESDQKLYFSRSSRNGKFKIDVDKIKQAQKFESETLSNFEQLFNELKIPKLTKT